MRIPEMKLAEVWDRGFSVIEGFLDKETLKEAQEGLWSLYPRPEEYFANPEKYAKFSSTQFSGLELFPYPDWALNRLCVHPDLIDGAERFLSSKDLEIYKVELWAKYSGAINYDQPLHRDYGNHSLVVPRADGANTQMTTFILLSDVTEHDGPTKLVPLEYSRDVPNWPVWPATTAAELREKEVAATAPAGSLMIYKTDVLHRGSEFTLPNRSRFCLLVDFQERGLPWTGKMSWPSRALSPLMGQALSRMTPRQRDLFGWPPAGSPYWNEQTLRDVGLRYPEMDLSPYAAGAPRSMRKVQGI
ncbi:MAG: phytanoyl-CoA dioxygenase family protein [Polyangiaceae bacterium]|nr:phytanoyl-CoA dioxygenase family protein [Polyangiaceae bacterium]